MRIQLMSNVAFEGQWPHNVKYTIMNIIYTFNLIFNTWETKQHNCIPISLKLM